MKKLALTKEKKLAIYARINETGVTRILSFFDVDDDGTRTAHPINSLGFQLIGKKSPFATSNLFILSEGLGLTVQGSSLNELAIDLSSANATQKPIEIFYQLFSSVEDNTWLNGPWFFHDGEFDGVEDTDDILIGADSDVIIEISSSGLSRSDINTRVQSAISTATLTPSIDDYDMAAITAQAEALVIAAPTGTPSNGNAFVFRIKDDGTARALTFNAIYRAIGSALPTTTTISKTLYFCAVYNSTAVKWDVFPSQLEV